MKTRPKLVSQTPAQAMAKRNQIRLSRLTQPQKAALNTVRRGADGGDALCDTAVQKFGERLVFPFLDEIERNGMEITTKLVRSVLKRARDESLLLPSQYRLAKEHALALWKEWKRRKALVAPLS